MNPHRSAAPTSRAQVAIATVFAAALTTALPTSAWAQAPAAAVPSLVPLPTLDVPSYMGTWYQVALFPNRFQKQCLSDTTAQYRQLDDGRIEVRNRCREADGRFSEALGIARTENSRLEGATLAPATLAVSFLPAWLRWVPAWGDYWVIARASDGRYAVVSEPQRRYLWVLARTPSLSAEDEAAIRSTLTARGFDLSRWQAHPHTADAPRSP